MDTSFFEYPITRRYPYKWFTPVTIIGVFVALLIFSLVNVASNGYILENQYTSDPNTTSAVTWFERWPSVSGSKIKASCQASVASLGSSFLTNNSALSYAIEAVTRHPASGEEQHLPGLVYNSNPLQNCRLLSITILLNWANGGRSAAQIAWSAWEAVLEGRLVCDVANGQEGLTSLNITASYNLVPSTASIYTGDFRFTGRNETTQASLYWGESILAGYWYQLTVKLYQSIQTDFIALGKPGLTSGYLYLVPNKTIADIKNLSYFNLLARWIVIEPNNDDMSYYGNDTDTPASLLKAGIMPGFWIEADTMAKAFYSTIMIDLGQVDAKNNILTDPALLAHFTANLSQTVTSAGQQWGPMRVQYNTKNSTVGPLTVKPSVLIMEYLCQVPVLKEPGSLFVSLIVADLVFVQALWFLFKHATVYFMRRRERARNYCEGCLQQMPMIMSGENSSHIPLRPLEVLTAYEGLRDQDGFNYGEHSLPTSIPPKRFRMGVRETGWRKLTP